MSCFIVLELLLGNSNPRQDVNTYYSRCLKHLRDTANPFLIPDRHFLKLYRLPKTIAHDIISELQVFVEGPERENAIPFFIKFLMTLHFLGYGSYQKAAASNSFNAMSQSSASRFIGEICELIVKKLFNKYILFPTTNETINKAKEGFFLKWGCRGTIGAIDGTHVSIIAPSFNDVDHPPNVYINRKSYHSINVMLICDSDCKIIACDARYPGSVHDSAIFQVSNIRHFLKRNYENGDHVTRLIGDSGYALEPWLFTPFRSTSLNSPEYHFNNQHKTSRNVIERTNGILKARFRCLLKHRVLHYHPAKAGLIIYACTILHNILVNNKILEPIQDDSEEENIQNLDDDNMYEVEESSLYRMDLGARARAEYVRNNFM